MNMDRRQFLLGALATGAVVAGATAVSTTGAQAAAPRQSAAALGSAEQWLLGTARRALA